MAAGVLMRTATVLALTTLVVAGSAMPVRAAEAPPRVLVMPFENTGHDRRYFWIGEAAAVVLADRLSSRGVDAISHDERSAAFERLQVPVTAVLTDATAFRIAELVGATQVVVGTFRIDGDAMTVRARAIGLEAGVLRHAIAESGTLSEFFTLFDDMAGRIAPASGAVARPSDPSERPSIAVLENYIKGVIAEEPSTAARYLTTALRDDPGYDQVRLALWRVYTGQGEHDRARMAVEAVKADSPFADRAAFLGGLSQLSARKPADAVATFDRLAARRTTPNLVNNAGVARLRRDWPNALEAAGFFRRAHEAEPDDPDYLFNLGYATWLGRDATGAVRWLREMVRRSPADGDAHFLLGIALADAGETSEAAREKDLARRLSSSYDNWDKGSGVERVPKGVERVKGSVDLPRRVGIEETLASAGQRDQRELARFYLDRARRAFENGSDRDATSDLERALYHAPYNAEAHVLMGRIHARGGRLPDAVNAFKVALWSAESADAHVALAEVLLRTDDRDGARREAERALVLAPGHPAAGRLLETLGRP